ncbi:MAG: hypothetical protein H6907_13815 [Hyphomicrobiales bacterium]|nr:hypothetical protein [Hyphomicrobiales bacterium]MCP5372799.1 hypothetical protein [Hyphomicrobiales bacterium]
MGLREVLYEFRPSGAYVRVAAIDPHSNTEVTVVGDPRQGEAVLKRIALRKLIYVLAKGRR